jgi:hypothetical protein
MVVYECCGTVMGFVTQAASGVVECGLLVGIRVLDSGSYRNHKQLPLRSTQDDGSLCLPDDN